MAENPHIAYVDQRRGFVMCRLDGQQLKAGFHTMPYVSKRNAPATVSASFTVQDGAHRLSSSTPPSQARQDGAKAP